MSDTDRDALVQQARTLSERAQAFSNKHTLETETIGSEILSLFTAIRDALKRDPNDPIIRRAEGIVKGKEGPGGDLRRLLPSQSKHRPAIPLFVRLFTGDKIKLHMLAHEDAQAIKHEYHRFRELTAIAFTVLPCIILGLQLLTGGRWHPKDLFTVPANDPTTSAVHTSPLVILVCQVLIAALLYFYTALSIREGILKVNGSNIKAWWIYHHYISLGALLVLLTMRIEYLGFIKHFLFMVFQQGVVMMLYNRFQRRRLYSRIALGKSSTMDIVGGESSGAHGQLKLLYPLLFFLQGYQVYVGVMLIAFYWASFFEPRGWIHPTKDQEDLWSARGSCFLGAIFILLGVGNFFATVATFLSKRRAALRAAKQQKAGKKN